MKRGQFYAHYFASKKRKYVLITKACTPKDPVENIEVSGKVEARKVAADNDATPWNF